MASILDEMAVANAQEAVNKEEEYIDGINRLLRNIQNKHNRQVHIQTRNKKKRVEYVVKILYGAPAYRQLEENNPYMYYTDRDPEKRIYLIAELDKPITGEIRKAWLDLICDKTEWDRPHKMDKHYMRWTVSRDETDKN